MIEFSPQVLKEKTSSSSVNLSNKNNFNNKSQKLNNFLSHSSNNSNTSKGDILTNINNRQSKSQNKSSIKGPKDFNELANFNNNNEEECINFKSNSIMHSSSGFSEGSKDDTKIIEELNLNFLNSDIKINLLKNIKIKNKRNNQNKDNLSQSEYSSLSNPKVIIDLKNNPECNNSLKNTRKHQIQMSDKQFKGRTISPSFKQNKFNKKKENQTSKVSNQSKITNVNQLNIKNININSNNQLDLFTDIASCFYSESGIDQVFSTEVLNSNLKNLKENSQEKTKNPERSYVKPSKNSKLEYNNINEKLKFSSLKKTLMNNHNTDFSLANSKNMNIITEDTKANIPVNNYDEAKTDITDTMNKKNRSLLKNLKNPINNEDILFNNVNKDNQNDLDFLNINTENSHSYLDNNKINHNIITDNQSKTQSNNISRQRKSKIKSDENSKEITNTYSPTKVNPNIEDTKIKNKKNANDNNYSNTNIILKKDLREIAEKSKLDINEEEIESFKITKYKILIVDDHKFLRESLKNIILKILKKRNILKYFQVIEGIDGVDILYHIINDQAQNNLIKCVITDENMEYINGSQAIKIIKELETQLKIKPIALASITAYSDEFMKDQTGGIDCFLPKPCSEKHLLKFFEDFNIFFCEE